jgi:hypothetical protein
MFSEEPKKIQLIDDDSEWFSTKGMYYKEFPSLYNQIRAFALFIVQKAPESFKEVNLLEQQVSEIIKNAIKHGNRCVPSKKIKVWYDFAEKESQVKVIVQDEGSGFQNLETWNDFFDKRHQAFVNGDFEEMLKYAAFKTENSDEDDGGNALFAAVEYWNKCYGFNKNGRNKVVAIREF